MTLAQTNPKSGSTCHRAHFAIQWLRSSTAIVTAHGDIDAANAVEFIDFALRPADQMTSLVLDLAGVEFFGCAGFSALHTLNVRCAADNIHWAMAPSKSVTRLLQICDPDATLPVHPGADAALAAVIAEPRRLLQLVPQPS